MRVTMRSTARLAAALTLSTVVGGVTPAALAAQPTTVTFNSLTESSPGSGVRFTGNCYSESGFVFTVVGVPCTGAAAANAFVAGNMNSPIFGGGTTPSLLLNSPTGSVIDIMRTGGGTFSFTGIDLAPYFEANTSVLFTGFGVGIMPTQTFLLSGLQAGFQRFAFGSAFSNLTSLRITANNEFGEPLVKFDNFSANASQVAVVPEPSTVLLSAVGLVGIAVVAKRRRTRA